MTEELSTKLDQVIEESREVREISAIAEKARKRLQIIVLVCTGVALAILAAVLWAVLETRETTRQTRELADTIACYTTEGEPCFEQQRARSNETVQRLVDALITVEECSRQTDVRTCVEQQLSP